MPSSCRSAGEIECGVGQVRLSLCVSYEERRVAVGLPDSECVVSGRSVCLCVCHTKNTGSRRSAGESECGVGQVRLSLCVSYEERRVAVGLPDSECVVLGRSVSLCVCVCHSRNAE